MQRTSANHARQTTQQPSKSWSHSCFTRTLPCCMSCSCMAKYSASQGSGSRMMIGCRSMMLEYINTVVSTRRDQLRVKRNLQPDTNTNTFPTHQAATVRHGSLAALAAASCDASAAARSAKYACVALGFFPLRFLGLSCPRCGDAARGGDDSCFAWGCAAAAAAAVEWGLAPPAAAPCTVGGGILLLPWRRAAGAIVPVVGSLRLRTRALPPRRTRCWSMLPVFRVACQSGGY